MGTRGLLGFIVNGEPKLSYNHWDSYPSGLGLDVLRWLKANHSDLAALAEKAATLRLVTEDEEAPLEDVTRLAQFADVNVGSSDTRSWYVLLRDTQGDPAKILDAGVMLDKCDFAADSLFCEWGYVVNFDDGVLEVYQGFQTSPHDKGRFASMPLVSYHVPGTTYYPIALIASWPFDALPSEKEFQATLCDEEDVE